MKIENHRFDPDPELERREMEELQRKIAEEAVWKDCVESSVNEMTIVGIDQAFTDDKVISGAVIMEDGEIVEKVSAKERLEMPYIPGLLAFREAPAIISVLEKLDSDPDLLVLDGSGRIHFREAGIATHIGVIFGIPAIGVAKNLLCGEPVRAVDLLEEGEKVKVVADENVETAENEVIGYAFQSRQYRDSKKINPLYVSSVHRVSARKAVKVVEKLCSGYKLPEPIRLADKFVDEIKSDN